jgi:dTDP-4-dehydrorhamnose reductase
MRILITGSDGLVGTNIIPLLRGYFDVIPAVEADWDICDRSRGLEMIEGTRPDVLLNLAALTNVDGCEDQPDLAFRVNGEGPAVLADICSGKGVKLVHFSTDYVFDGMKTAPYVEEDRTGPISVYGKSKLMGEQAVTARGPGNLVVRTEWIYGKGGISFVEKIMKIGKEIGEVAVVNDQTGSPTYARDLAFPLAALLRGNRSGIYHVTNSGSCSWFEFAKTIFSILDMRIVCKPITTNQSQRKAPRPSNSVMDCTKLEIDTGLQMRHWKDALCDYLVRS